ncbi:MAG: NifB/NifX family molybdenum-iron cluster-binding protein [Candidatus Gastranaerophilales bacterium]|nr:NifB/NifX family molybdenum-iron cluster-binding protein [Candidatus Gastranaerophilales bacterium]
MKFAIPTNNGQLCLHFGHCEVFTFIEADEKTKEILNKEELTPPPHEPGVLPAWLAEKSVNVVIAGGMGSRAQQLFAEQGIKVIVGSMETIPEKMVVLYLNNALESGINACDH